MRVLNIFMLIAGGFAANIVDPKDCKIFPCLIFYDEFDFLDHDAWEHEITMAGGGNSEFQVYVNNRSISYAKGSMLYIKPALVSEWKDEEFLTSGELDLWGTNGLGDVCTGNAYDGCKRVGNSTNIINPIQSARLRTLPYFAVRYGRVEVRARMPRGDWLWAAISLLPRKCPYGAWPASGEIDIVECRGNDNYGKMGNHYSGTTMHWGPYRSLDRYDLTQHTYETPDSSFADNFHKWRIDWTQDKFETYLDDSLVMTVDPGINFWNLGGFGNNIDNIWQNGEKMAPFDQKFYLVLNLAVGGTGGFFPDNVPNVTKPWSNNSPTPLADFWNSSSTWLPTWKQGEDKISEKAALEIDYIKVWKLRDKIQ